MQKSERIWKILPSHAVQYPLRGPMVISNFVRLIKFVTTARLFAYLYCLTSFKKQLNHFKYAPVI